MPNATVEQELIAALLVVLEMRWPGVARRMQVVLEDDEWPPAEWPENVVPLRPALPPTPQRAEAAAWVERAAVLIEEARSWEPPEGK